MEAQILESLSEDLGASDISFSTDWSSSSSDSDDEYCSRRKIEAILNFTEQIVPKFEDKQFRENFRLSRATNNYLVDQLTSADVLPKHTYGRQKVSPMKAMLMTLWYLGNMESFRQLASRFGVSQACAYVVIRKVVKFCVNMSPKFIQFPKDDCALENIEKFYKMKGIQGVEGAIDGCHIKIIRPGKNQQAYCNRKGYHSIILQAVCDNKKRFLDVFCGEAGSLHDARVLKRASLYERCNKGQLLKNTFILGDSAYPSLRWLVPPYKETGFLTAQQREFNYKHSATRMVIENAFGLLKGRFRRLKTFENRNIQFIVESVVASCVLHNVCIHFDDLGEDFTVPTANEEQEIDCGETDFAYNKREEVFSRMFIS